jgi:hypothetical protein
LNKKAFAEITDDHVKTGAVTETLDRTLAQVKKGVAFEIEGHEMTSEP